MLFYFDENGIYLTKLTKSDLENYINYLQRKDVRVATINSHLGEISKFIYYLETKECIQPLGFHFEKYRGFEVYTHNDISVSKEDQRKVFEVLGYFPEELRLMFLNLWCLGIRVNEVCTIKGKHSICERPGYPKGAELLWRDARAEPLILLVGNGIKPMGQFSDCY